MRPIPFNNTYIALPARFYSRQGPTPVKAPAMVHYNQLLAVQLGIDLDWLISPAGTAALAGNTLPDGAEPIATVYAGHQFGSWNPQLGDGRAVLLGEVIGKDGNRYDIQLKGAGETPYSRSGDGRSPLGPVLREYLVSEAMAALGVPTSRSLAAISSGEKVVRERLLAGGVLTRVARSHIRVGTFQYFSARADLEAVRLLADHVIERHYPEANQADNPYLSLLEQVIAAQARLIAQWMQLGFIHGVMNTDNMLVGGETIDYGPCAFMDAFDPETVFSSIDHGGRYAYRNQPAIAQWNLMWLAQALLPLLADNEAKALPMAQAAIDAFAPQYLRAYESGMLAKLGLYHPNESNVSLIKPLLSLMSEHQLDYTLTLRTLAKEVPGAPALKENHSAWLKLPEAFNPWLYTWHQALAAEGLPACEQQALILGRNPVFIPRNHRVEAAITSAYQGDLQPFQTLVDVLAKPFDYAPDRAHYAAPPEPGESVCRTFCGT